MNRTGTKLLILFVFSASCFLLGAGGCGLFRKKGEKPPSEGIVQESESLRLIGFQETVTIKTSLDELVATLADPSGFMPEWVKIGKVAVGEEGLPILASTVPFTVTAFGVDIKGKLIVVKSDREHMWFLWDSPYSIQVQRWEFKQVGDGMRLTLKVVTQLPSGGQFPGMDSMVDLLTNDMFNDIDFLLARIQAHFDPSLKPEELVAMGFRGEAYEALMQLHRAVLDISEPPDRVNHWITRAENIPLFMDEFDTEEKYLVEAQNAGIDELVYMPTGIKYGIFRANTDAFVIKKKKGKSYAVSIYLVVFGRVALIESDMDPDKGGTNMTFKVLFEIPSFATEERMEMLTYLARVPKLLADKAMVIKNGVEGGE